MPAVTPSIIALPAIADLDMLDAVRDRIAEAIEGPVVIDANGVERCSTNMALMLLSAAQTAARNGVGLSLSRPSAAFLRATERLGLAGRFAPLIQG